MFEVMYALSTTTSGIKLSSFKVNEFADELGFGDWFKGKNIDPVLTVYSS